LEWWRSPLLLSASSESSLGSLMDKDEDLPPPPSIPLSPAYTLGTVEVGEDAVLSYPEMVDTWTHSLGRPLNQEALQVAHALISMGMTLRADRKYGDLD
jgi:hypothetical protein